MNDNDKPYYTRRMRAKFMMTKLKKKGKSLQI